MSQCDSGQQDSCQDEVKWTDVRTFIWDLDRSIWPDRCFITFTNLKDLERFKTRLLRSKRSIWWKQAFQKLPTKQTHFTRPTRKETWRFMIRTWRNSITVNIELDVFEYVATLEKKKQTGTQNAAGWAWWRETVRREQGSTWLKDTSGIFFFSSSFLYFPSPSFWSRFTYLKT